jgi:PIN domain nuclease of toxin-antitoxin system
MNIFIDTSSLFKLYHAEQGSEEMLSLFNKYEISTIYLSEITKIEFDSVVWK